MVRLQSCTKKHKPLYIVYTIYPLAGSALGGVMPNAVLFSFFFFFFYKTCSVLCVLEH